MRAVHTSMVVPEEMEISAVMAVLVAMERTGPTLPLTMEAMAMSREVLVGEAPKDMAVLQISALEQTVEL